MSVYKFYHESSNTGKVIIISVGAAACVAAYFGIVSPVIKLIKNKLDQSKTVKEGKAAGSELRDLAGSGIVPTINNAQAQSFCNSLVSAFEGCGTDEDAINNIMGQMKNDADVYLLINTYGTRKYDACGWGTGDTEKSLAGAISDELDSSEKDDVNKILSGNGIKYQFS